MELRSKSYLEAKIKELKDENTDLLLENSRLTTNLFLCRVGFLAYFFISFIIVIAASGI